MLKGEERMEMRVLWKRGAGIRALSRDTGRSCNTVRRYVRGGDETAVRKAGPRRPEKLDPYKAYVVERLEAAAPDRIPETVLLREIKARGPQAIKYVSQALMSDNRPIYTNAT